MQQLNIFPAPIPFPELPLQYRLSKEIDLPFIMSSWLKSARNNHTNEFIPNEVYYAEYKQIVANTLKNSQVFIAHLDDEPDTIIAYMVYQYINHGKEVAIHWAYTKGDGDLYRRKGIQSAILKLITGAFIETPPIIFTAFPRKEEMFKHLKREYTVIFDPFFNTKAI